MAVEAMQRLVAALPEQLRWGANLSVPDLSPAPMALVAGMGGSGIAADFAAELCARHHRLLVVQKGYGLPAWSAAQVPLVVGLSYSGNTEETLSVVAEAHAAGLSVASVGGGGELAAMARAKGWPHVTVPSGAPPRAALGWMLSGLLSVLSGASLLPAPRKDLLEAGAVVADLVAEDGAYHAEAATIASRLVGRITIVHASSGLTAPPAQRWKTQINENAKAPAWWSLYPELDHNEILGWDQTTGAHVGIVTLRDREESPAIAARIALTTELTSGGAVQIAQVWSVGDSILSRMLSLAVMGDLVSVALAAETGRDPMPYELIEQLKARLAASASGS